MKTKLVIYFALLFSVFMLSCSNSDITKPVNETEFSAQQIPGCNKPTSLAKINYLDSCFAYTFNDTLKVEFCVAGNCCPDSNRFVTDYSISNDTIFVAVSDTAKNLCHCTCSYIIHLELTNLYEKQYLFYCDYDSMFLYKENIYN